MGPKIFTNEEGVFACSKCDKTYTIKSSLYSHINKKHKEVPNVAVVVNDLEVVGDGPPKNPFEDDIPADVTFNTEDEQETDMENRGVSMWIENEVEKQLAGRLHLVSTRELDSLLVTREDSILGQVEALEAGLPGSTWGRTTT
jgi:DNA-directed RNA polymerase subunit M/transcription elongation factor TFIIS